MRKIEALMIKAVKFGESWKQDNTEVDASNDHIRVYLHGNLIASSMYDKPEALYPSNYTWSQFPTRTTASRLRALGFKFNKKIGCWE